MKQVNVERAKSAAGILLVGVGIFLLRQHLNQTMAHVNYLLGNVPSGGAFPVVVTDEARQTWQASGADFNRILQQVLQQIFVCVWPLLLVRFGIGLSTGCQREQ
jgi:hypothetical protein